MAGCDFEPEHQEHCVCVKGSFRIRVLPEAMLVSHYTVTSPLKHPFLFPSWIFGICALKVPDQKYFYMIHLVKRQRLEQITMSLCEVMPRI